MNSQGWLKAAVPRSDLGGWVSSGGGRRCEPGTEVTCLTRCRARNCHSGRRGNRGPMEPRKADEQLGVLIVGAGPTGLALAVQLQALGVPFRIIDRQLDRARESRALAVQPRTLELLRTVWNTRELVQRRKRCV